MRSIASLDLELIWRRLMITLILTLILFQYWLALVRASLSIDAVARRVLQGLPLRRCQRLALIGLRSVVDVLFDLEITVLDVECILGIYFYWHVVLQFCFLSLISDLNVE